MPARDHRAGGTSTSVEEMIADMTPGIEWLIAQIEPGEFTTTEFIELMQQVPQTAQLYTESVKRWGEGDRPSRMVIHGQVIPAILRRSERVEWVGYAHDVQDDYAVPAWWRVIELKDPPQPGS